MVITRTPRGLLRPFVKSLWAIDRAVPRRPRVAARELVLPTGLMHLAVTLTDDPFRFYAAPRDQIDCIRTYTVVGGSRARPYVRCIPQPGHSVGALFHPGACQTLFGMPADALAGRHIELDDLWGSSARELRERLQVASTPEERLDVLESQFATRAHEGRGIHPAVAHALERFKARVHVNDVVRETGYSHRRFIALFRQAVGQTPKLYCRVRRFQRALATMAAEPTLMPAALAFEAGYSDQSHFNREFQAFAGISPGEHRSRRPMTPHHVPIPWPDAG